MQKASRGEIANIFSSYKTQIDTTFSNDDDFINVLNGIEQCESSEQPDGIYIAENHCYGVEHFQVSMNKVDKNQDVSRIAEGSMNNREKMKQDREFHLDPNIGNLISSLERVVNSHSKSFELYKKKLSSKYPDKSYRLILFIEDATNSAYIVKHKSFDNKTINPLMMQQLADVLLTYISDVYGVIYSYGNEISKVITGCTLNELQEKKNCDLLLNADDYTSFEREKKKFVSKDGENDNTIVTIKLFDKF